MYKMIKQLWWLSEPVLVTASVLFDLLSNIYTIIKKCCLNTVLNEASIHEKSDHFSCLKLLYILIKNIYILTETELGQEWHFRNPSIMHGRSAVCFNSEFRMSIFIQNFMSLSIFCTFPKHRLCLCSGGKKSYEWWLQITLQMEVKYTQRSNSNCKLKASAQEAMFNLHGHGQPFWAST